MKAIGQICLFTAMLLLAGQCLAQTGKRSVQPSEKLAAVSNLKTRNALVSDRSIPAVELSPMMQEIKTVLDSSRTAESAILREINAAEDDGGALAAKAEVERLQRDTRLKILRVQLRYARQEGRDDLTRRIEASILSMINPADRRYAEPAVQDAEAP